MDNQNEKIILGKDFLDYAFEAIDIKDRMTTQTIIRFILRAMMAGIVVGIGYLTYLTVDGHFSQMALGATAQGEGTTLQGFGHFFSGWIFGFCLIFIYYSKAELLTSNMMVLTVGKYYNKLSFSKFFKILFACFIGNILGGIVIGLLIGSSSLITGSEETTRILQSVIATKQAYITDNTASNWMPLLDLFVRAVLCNFMINLSMIMVYGGNIKNDVAKMLVMFGGVFFFMYLGFEHSIANSVIFIVAAFTPGSGLEPINAILNILVVLIGNYVGGGVLIGLYYAFLNDKKQLTNK